VKKIVALIGGCLLWHGFVSAEISVRVLDSAGIPISNAVISIPLSEKNSSLATNIDKADMMPAIMDQVDKQFLPHVLLVNKAQSVIFPNSDQVRHHVYSFSKPNDFEIRLYSGNQAEPVTFLEPGVVVLGCNIHDKMLGYLYVQDNEIASISDQNGVARFDNEFLNETAQDQVVTIWHSQLSSNKTDRVTKLLQEKDENGVWLLHLELIPEVKKTKRTFKLRYP
tara:strand:- start:201 stop:872 length:672 start_codon:yes stop_codon:yes gene_type:complete